MIVVTMYSLVVACCDPQVRLSCWASWNHNFSGRQLRLPIPPSSSPHFRHNTCRHTTNTGNALRCRQHM